VICGLQIITGIFNPHKMLTTQQQDKSWSNKLHRFVGDVFTRTMLVDNITKPQ
jgi:hypothetical protein